ncbi:MAG: ubiquinol-cytochrome c reductase iron-sulfur subunit [Alphaproteobacteria bacterium]|nr:ubiquinol-cytochrome c reductase iron-sulfur subunit [Alphaproteobacteria bacterium]
MATTADHKGGHGTRRDFLFVAATGAAAVGVAYTAWPFINSMNPSADVLALASTEVDLSPIEEGQSITVTWRGRPVFVRHRTKDEIARAKADDKAGLPDPVPDAQRVQKAEWLILVGVCTHLGCIPLGQKSTDPRGDFGGWFCPCHGSHYDTAGRIRKGPAPHNLAVPQYTYLDDKRIRIG